MGSIDQFLPGLATGSEEVSTGSGVVDMGTDIFGDVLRFFGDMVSTVTGSLAEA